MQAGREHVDAQDAADVAVGDQVAQMAEGRDRARLQADDRADPRALGEVAQRDRLVRRRADRPFAEDRLAGGDRRLRGRAVAGRLGGDRDQVDRRVAGQLARNGRTRAGCRTARPPRPRWRGASCRRRRSRSWAAHPVRGCGPWSPSRARCWRRSGPTAIAPPRRVMRRPRSRRERRPAAGSGSRRHGAGAATRPRGARRRRDRSQRS